MKIYVVVAIAVIGGLVNVVESFSAILDSDLAYIRAHTPMEAGRDAFLSAYDTVIRESTPSGVVSSAMVDIGNMYCQQLNPKFGFIPDSDTALLWYRRAVKAATPGSDEWYEAQFRVSGMVRDSSPKEALEILKDVKDRAQNNATVLAKAMAESVVINLYSGDRIGAEAEFKVLAGWLSDPNLPKIQEPQRISFAFIVQGAGGALIGYYKSTSLSEKEKLEKIGNIAAMAKGWGRIQEDAKRAHSEIRRQVAAPLEPTFDASQR